MKRKAMEKLNEWFYSSNRHPLIIRGARQTGKSTLVRLFCNTKKIDLCEINLEIDKVPEFSKQDSFNLDNAINQIEAIINKKITQDSILFIDEIQQQPFATKWLRYFYEKKQELPVIAAGSLLEVVLKNLSIEMPVGRIEYFHLGPVVFSEFLWAKGKENLSQYIAEFNFNRNHIPKEFHEELIYLLKEYYYVGGMPEAIVQYLDKGPIGAREVHRRLIQTYEDDLKKYATNKTGEALRDVFNNLPATIGEKTIFTKLSQIKSTNVREAIELLTLARIIHKSIHTDCSGIPIKASEDRNTSSLFFMDIGLMNYMMGISFKNIIELNGEKLISSGKMAEQFIASHLAYRKGGFENIHLNFYLRDKNIQKAQIDFIIQHEHNIIPIEVKAGTSGKMKGLNLFMQEKKLPMAIRLDAKYREQQLQCNKNNSFDILNVPLYQVELLFEENITKLIDLNRSSSVRTY